MKYDFELDIESNNSLSIIIKQLKKDATVLEFGPANGRLTKYMKEVMNAKVYLAELDQEAGRDALKYGVDLVVGDIEEYQWKEQYKDIKFDHIIFADVLEHLRNPLRVLQAVKEFLKEDGTILLSVPNVAHNSVLIDLMNNKFEYNSIGLLDDTHIHFFTKTSLDKMVSDAGLYVSKEMATYAKVGTIEIKNSINDVESIKPAYWNKRQYGQVYQYVYELTTKPVETVKNIESNTDDYNFQMFYDNEGNWTAEDSITKVIDINAEEQSIEIDIPKEVSLIRIDPLNANCIVQMLDVTGYNNGQQIEAVRKVSNEKALCQDIFFFESEDPQLHYEFSMPVNEVKVKYKILDIDILKGMCNSEGFEIVLETVKNKCDAVRINNEQLQIALQQEKARADALQAQRDMLESKKLYKLYKFFKRK